MALVHTVHWLSHVNGPAATGNNALAEYGLQALMLYQSCTVQFDAPTRMPQRFGVGDELPLPNDTAYAFLYCSALAPSSTVMDKKTSSPPSWVPQLIWIHSSLPTIVSICFIGCAYF
jgi:hypothetical protein